jgi:hypothetical protein
MAQVGNGLSQSIEMMAQAVMAQTINNSHVQPFNQNRFYQHNIPNVYSVPTSHQVAVHGSQLNVNPTNIHPNQMQNASNSNEGHGEENVYHQL